MRSPNQFAEFISKRLSKSDRAVAFKIADKLSQQPQAQPMTRREIARDAVAVAKIASKVAGKKAPGASVRALKEVAGRYNASVLIGDVVCESTGTSFALRFDDMLAPRIPLPANHPAHNVLFVA